MARLSFRCSDDLVAAVDAERGLIPREAWLRRAVERALDESAPGAQPAGARPSGVDPEVAGSNPALGPKAPGSSVGRASDVVTAPAEQPKRARGAVVPDRARSPRTARSVSQPGPDVSRVRSSAQVQRSGPQPKGGKK